MIEKIDYTIAKALSLDIADVESAISRSFEINKKPYNAPLKKLFEKAAKGEDITIALFGGSITEGAWATTCRDIGNNATQYTADLGGELCYGLRVAEWFKQTFKEINVNVVNAGIGATPSFLGAFRMDQMVLDHNPDFVIIEFAINDVTADNLLEGEIFAAYESIVRRCIDNNIASMLVFTLNESYKSMQDHYSKIGEYYGIPMISYRDAIMPNGKLIFEKWNMISPDVVHPNNVGHALIGRLITEYLENIYNSDIESGNINVFSQKEWLYKDTFYNSKLYSAADYKACAEGGFAYQENIKDVSYKWRGAWVCDGTSEGKVQFIVPKGAKKVFVLWFPTEKGSFKAEFIGKSVSQDTALAPNSFARACWTRVYDDEFTKNDSPLTLEATGMVTVMGIMITY